MRTLLSLSHVMKMGLYVLTIYIFCMFLLLFLLKLENTENKKQHLVCEIKKKMIYVHRLSMIHLANKNSFSILFDIFDTKINFDHYGK